MLSTASLKRQADSEASNPADNAVRYLLLLSSQQQKNNLCTLLKIDRFSLSNVVGSAPFHHEDWLVKVYPPLLPLVLLSIDFSLSCYNPLFH